MNFIEEIGAYVRKYAPTYEIRVISPIIAQAVLESASGTSELSAVHNYFGLKWRANRCPTSNGVYHKAGSEQNPDGSYVSSEMMWFSFPDMESGVIGYFDFINIANYANLKGVSDPETYLKNIKADGYATSINYVEKCMNVIRKYDLERFDKKDVDEMKVFLSAGHGGSDPGAVAFGMQEKNINLQTLLACKDELERHGITVICSRTTDENDPVSQEVKEANASGADLVVSFHANAGGGDGFEVFCNPSNAAGVRLAQMAEKEVAAIGQNSRGVKNGMHLYFIKNTKATAVLFESFFVDNDRDNDIGDTIEEQKKFGIAYAKAILAHLGVAYKEKAGSDDKAFLYRVQCGAFRNKNNAEALKERLQADGYSAFVVRA